MKKTGSHDSTRRLTAKGVEASGIPVFCSFTKIAPAAELKPFPGNWNKHPAAQLDRYERVVMGNGWRRAVVVSALSGCITKGHGAWQMAPRRGLEVPVEIQVYRNRAEEIRDLVADNKLADLAESDDEALLKLLSELDATDLQFAAVTSAELERLMAETDIPEGEFPITSKLGESYDYVLIFTTNATEFAFLQTLLNIRQERSYKKTGVGLGRAIPLDRALKALHENRHSIHVAGKLDDEPLAPSKRGRVRATKPVRRVRQGGPKRTAAKSP
jgi:hypothetical protein